MAPRQGCLIDSYTGELAEDMWVEDRGRPDREIATPPIEALCRVRELQDQLALSTA